jgi:hypothetical protein
VAHPGKRLIRDQGAQIQSSLPEPFFNNLQLFFGSPPIAGIDEFEAAEAAKITLPFLAAD